MKTLEQIKNDYALTQGFSNWDDLDFIINDSKEFDEHWKNVCVIAQKECLKLASQNSKVLVEGILTQERKILFTLFDKVKGVVKRKVSVCKESINNENNIIR